MKVSRGLVVFALVAVGSYIGSAQSISVQLPTTSTVGSVITIKMSALDANKNPDTSYTGSVTLKTTDDNALLPVSTVAFANGVGTFTIAFMSPGVQSLSVVDKAWLAVQVGRRQML
jgi:hypothetical protein